MVSSCTARCPEHGEGPNYAAQSLVRRPGAGRLMDKKQEGGQALAKIYGRNIYALGALPDTNE